MEDASIAFPGLGTLSRLPPEVRDKIYGDVLFFERPEKPKPCCGCESGSDSDSDYEDEFVGIFRSPPGGWSDGTHRASLLRVSRRIYDEARLEMFRVNEFTMWIDRDAYGHYPENTSVAGEAGFRLLMGHSQLSRKVRGGYTGYSGPRLDMPIPFDMLPHIQLLHVSVGTFVGNREEDIVPLSSNISGPESPDYHTLSEMIEMLCERILKRCHLLRLLRISLRSIEQTPQSMREIIKPFIALRGIGRTNATCMSMRENEGYKTWVDWNLKNSYGLYMNKVMALPEGTPRPEYVGDAEEPNQDEDDIFDMMGAVWMGGREFMYLDDEDADDVLDFMLPYIQNGILLPGVSPTDSYESLADSLAESLD